MASMKTDGATVHALKPTEIPRRTIKHLRDSAIEDPEGADLYHALAGAIEAAESAGDISLAIGISSLTSLAFSEDQANLKACVYGMMYLVDGLGMSTIGEANALQLIQIAAEEHY